MKKALILHVTAASPNDNWFLWLKKELENREYTVWLPQLPNSERPNVDTYNKFLLSNKDFIFDDETIIIGHSSGAVEILSLLDNFNNNQHVKAIYLVSAFKDDLGWESLKDLFLKEFNFENIKAHSGKFILFHSDNDPYCPIEHAKYLSSKLNGELIVLKGQGHFNTEQSDEYVRFPVLLDTIGSV